jgi:hypothetical protein
MEPTMNPRSPKVSVKAIGRGLLLAIAILTSTMSLVAQEADQWIDGWVFSGVSAETAQQTLVDRIESGLNELRGDVEVTDAQRESIRLSWELEVTELFRAIDDVREKYRGISADQDHINAIVQDVQPLQMRMQRMLNSRPKGLACKLLEPLLAPEQLEKFKQSREAERKASKRLYAESFLLTLQRRLPLLKSQREPLLELLIASRLEEKFNDHLDSESGYVIACIAFAGVADADYATVLDQDQLALLRSTLEIYAANGQWVDQMLLQLNAEVAP